MHAMDLALLVAEQPAAVLPRHHPPARFPAAVHGRHRHHRRAELLAAALLSQHHHTLHRQPMSPLPLLILRRLPIRRRLRLPRRARHLLLLLCISTAITEDIMGGISGWYSWRSGDITFDIPSGLGWLLPFDLLTTLAFHSCHFSLFRYIFRPI